MKQYHIYKKEIRTRTYFDDNLMSIPVSKEIKTGWDYLGFIEGTPKLLYFFFERKKVTLAALKRFCDKHTAKNFGAEVPEDSKYVYIVTDDKGKPLDVYTLLKEHCYNRQRKNSYVFRKSPVPSTGKGKWKFANYYRTFPKPKPKDTESYKEAFDSCEHIKIKEHDIPSTWDDIPRADFRDRSWKRHRRYQHKSNMPSYKEKRNNDIIEPLPQMIFIVVASTFDGC